MSTQALRPWTELVRLHPDVEAGELTEAMFAIDLGAVAAGDPNVPIVNRDPEAFFRATYLTADLRRILQEVLASLAGKAGYNRVLKLRTPFGGGKSHTLAALLHAARSRPALKASAGQWASIHPHVAEKAEPYGQAKVLKLDDIPDPGPVSVAVFDGEKFDARTGKVVEVVGQAASLSDQQASSRQHIRTMWGWLAWQIDPKRAFPIVADHDRDQVSPGGDVIKEMLTTGASGRPVLLLLDEVLKYMERAGAVAVLDSTLQRQAKDFFQNLTVEVAGSTNAVLVYSLTWSAREAGGNVALLSEIDKIAARVDQLREPVSGDEILPVLQRRLLGGPPPESLALEVANAYSEVVTHMRQADADTPSARREAEEEGIRLRDRMKAAYPFHPALIDVMKERWTSLDAFQRTRGALRFLATCLHSLKAEGGARPLLGPADIPLKSADVRLKMLKELGAQGDFDPVLTADIEGPNARAKQIDERLARETPALASVRPAARLATAIFAYSFGGLRREVSGESETLPPGVTEAELLASCVGPDLDNITARAVLAELRNKCLFLHHDGVRYCFKKEPNVTKLIEDAEQEVARKPEEIRQNIRELLGERLKGHPGAIIWPEKSLDLPDREPRFLAGYLPLEFAALSKAEQEAQAVELLTRYGDGPRRYRNGVGLAVPDKRQVEPLRRAVQYLMAIARVEEKKRQHRLTKDQLEQLKERRGTESAAAESALRNLYAAVWLPRVEENGRICLERIEVGGRPLQATGVHERVMELLTAMGIKRVYDTLAPRKIIERVRLGEPIAPGELPRLGVRTSDVRDAFFEVIEPPRLSSDVPLRAAIARGIAERVFGYTTVGQAAGLPAIVGQAAGLPAAAGGRFQVSPDRVLIGRQVADDEIDLDTGFLMLPSAIPAPAQPLVTTPATDDAATTTGVPAAGGEGTGPAVTPPSDQAQRVVSLRFKATREQVFKAFRAIANLADKADDGRITISVEATSEAGFDKSWLRNAVEGPLDEAEVDVP